MLLSTVQFINILPFLKLAIPKSRILFYKCG